MEMNLKNVLLRTEKNSNIVKNSTIYNSEEILKEIRKCFDKKNYVKVVKVDAASGDGCLIDNNEYEGSSFGSEEVSEVEKVGEVDRNDFIAEVTENSEILSENIENDRVELDQEVIEIFTPQLECYDDGMTLQDPLFSDFKDLFGKILDIFIYFRNFKRLL